jgi:hypothetical protein
MPPRGGGGREGEGVLTNVLDVGGGIETSIESEACVFCENDDKPGCKAMKDTWICTRLQHDGGQHVACGTSECSLTRWG